MQRTRYYARWRETLTKVGKYESTLAAMGPDVDKMRTAEPVPELVLPTLYDGLRRALADARPAAKKLAKAFAKKDATRKVGELQEAINGFAVKLYPVRRFWSAYAREQDWLSKNIGRKVDLTRPL